MKAHKQALLLVLLASVLLTPIIASATTEVDNPPAHYNYVYSYQLAGGTNKTISFPYTTHKNFNWTVQLEIINDNVSAHSDLDVFYFVDGTPPNADFYQMHFQKEVAQFELEVSGSTDGGGDWLLETEGMNNTARFIREQGSWTNATTTYDMTGTKFTNSTWVLPFPEDIYLEAEHNTVRVKLWLYTAEDLNPAEQQSSMLNLLLPLVVSLAIINMIIKQFEGMAK